MELLDNMYDAYVSFRGDMTYWHNDSLRVVLTKSVKTTENDLPTLTSIPSLNHLSSYVIGIVFPLIYITQDTLTEDYRGYAHKVFPT